jgi:hypothetical protein
MKKYLSILLTFCAAFAYAGDTPVFDEADDSECRIYAPIPFAANEPVFEEDDDQEEIANSEEGQSEDPTYAACDKCGEDGCDCCLDDEEESDENACRICKGEDEKDDETRRYFREEDEDNTETRYAIGLPIQRPVLDDSKDDLAKLHSYSQWGRYKSNFGMEKIFIRFPQKPAISQSSSLMTAYAYDHAVMYSFAGYFPPMGNIDPIAWFDEILYNVSGYPYNLVSHTIFQVSNGDWIMDYTVHDYVQNLVVKARAIMTPFNAYILQCVKPNGVRDYFNYFLDNFWIKCECHG